MTSRPTTPTPLKYPVSKPDISDDDIVAVVKTMKEGWISSQAPVIREFEEAFAQYVGTRYAVSCDSGTAALILAFNALNLAPGSEVICPEFTMYSSARGITANGLLPRFVDCDDSLNIDVDLIEEKITPQTKAILVVDIYGRPANMDAVMRIAHDYNLVVVEDVAEALGGTFNGKKLGSIGKMGCFSFYSNKIITAGMGGAITTDDRHLYEQLIHLRGLAFSDDHNFIHKKEAWNFRMTGLQASLALSQLKRIDQFLEKRALICEWYTKRLGPVMLPRPEGSILWMTDVLAPSERVRTKMMNHLASKGIESRLFFKPMSVQPSLPDEGKNDPEELKATMFSKIGFYLPTHTGLSRKDVDFVCKTLLEIKP